jgi:hypothetical protein
MRWFNTFANRCVLTVGSQREFLWFCTASDVYLDSFRVKYSWVASFSLHLQMLLVCSLSEGYVNSLDGLCDVCFVASSVHISLLWKRVFGHEPSVVTDFMWVISVVPYIGFRSSSNKTTQQQQLQPQQNLITICLRPSQGTVEYVTPRPPTLILCSPFNGF